MHTVKTHPNDRCPVCRGGPKASPRREAISRAASRAACALRTALFKVRLEANTRFRNMRGAALRATRLIVRDGLSIGGEALRDIGDAMVWVSDYITINDLRREVNVEPDNVDDEPDNVDDDERLAEPIGAAIADAMNLLGQANAALEEANAFRG